MGLRWSRNITGTNTSRPLRSPGARGRPETPSSPATPRCARSTWTSHLNIRALAVQQRPELLPRARGRLRWQQDVRDKDMREVVHQGDPQALQDYIEANREALEEELKNLKEAANFDAIAERHLPFSSDEWLQYLAQHEEQFRELLRTASQKRACISERVQARPNLQTATCIYPEATPKIGQSPVWAHLKEGYICFRASPQHQLVCFVATIGLTVYAIPLTATATRARYDLLFDPPIHLACRPIALVLEAAGLHGGGGVLLGR